MTQTDTHTGGKRLRLGTRASPLALAQAHQNGGDDQAVAARHGPWWQSPGRIAFHGWVPAAPPGGRSGAGRSSPQPGRTVQKARLRADMQRSLCEPFRAADDRSRHGSRAPQPL